MTSAQFQRVKELYGELDALPPENRAAALQERCPDDSVVRAEVARLLKSDGQPLLARATQQLDDLRQRQKENPESLLGVSIGPYEIERVLGQGGMGVVYLAQDKRLSRKTALKAVLPGEQREATFERLRREARVLASLSHPNLATVYGLEEHGGQLFLAMEYVEGKTLAQRLGRGTLPIGDALQCCEQIAAGLEVAHDRGVIHRDLKPGNIMFAADGNVKVLDFGVARVIQESDTPVATISQKGAIVGTPAYMSPEQTQGEPLTVQTDIFSLGAILFRCLTGTAPFAGELMADLLTSIRAHEPDWSLLPARLPESARRILKRCLAKDPAERYRHIGDARMDLHDARIAREWEKKPSDTRRISRTAIPIAMAVAVLATLLVTWAVRQPASTPVVHRFDLGFPGDTVQSDLERVQVALSRDGKNIVVACKTPTGQALWMRTHTADGEWHRLDQTDGGHRPFFSPDGQWITFFQAGQLYKRKISGGGDPIKLTPLTNWYGATWADDASIVYASAWGDGLQKMVPGVSGPKSCTTLDTTRNERAHIGPSMIPGTPWVLYNVWTGGESTDIRATNLQTGENHLVLSSGSTPHVASTPRGDYLLFERASIIFAVRLNRDTATTTGTETTIGEGVMNDGTRFAAYFDVAEDGTLVYFPGTSFAEESRLGFINPNMTTEPINDDRMSFCEPAFFAGGKKMAVLIKGKLYRCLVYDLERKTREFLVTGGDTISFCASPDGQTMACTVNRDGGYGVDLFSLADGHPMGRIVKPTEDYAADLSWSADGKLIMFSMAAKAGSPSDIWLVEPRPGSVPRTLVSTAGADIKPAFSPAGGWVAYASDTSGRNEIYLTSLPDGRATRQVTFEGGNKPVWSNDGKTLYFISLRGLQAVNLTAEGTVLGQPNLIYDKPFGQSDPIAREYTIAPDGRPLVVEPSERRPTVSHLRVITNWWTLLP